MTARRILFWVHLTAGAMAGVVILLMSVTGVLLAYKRQIIRWADGSFQSHPVPGARPLPMEEVLARVQASRGRMPSGITLRPGAREALAFDLGRERTVFVDRYTGQELGEESPKLRGFFSRLEDLHRWLGASTANRRYGRAITGACNLSFLVLLTTGPFLWWPREWTLANLKKIAVLRPGPWNRARDWNWHNTLGSWCAAPLFLVVVTGVIMSYPWANNLLYRLTGSAPPPPPSLAAGKGRPDRESQKGTGHDSRFDGLENLFARAARQVPGWTTISVRLAGAPSDQLTFSMDRGNGGRPDLRSQLTLDTASGAVTSMEDFSSYNRGRRLRLWARFTHTGEAFGATGQTIAGIASLGTSLLVFTGLSLALRRLAGWTKRRTLKRRSLKSEEAESSRIAV